MAEQLGRLPKRQGGDYYADDSHPLSFEEQIFRGAAERIDSLAEDLLQVAKADKTKDTLFAIKKEAHAIAKILNDIEDSSPKSKRRKK